MENNNKNELSAKSGMTIIKWSVLPFYGGVAASFITANAHEVYREGNMPLLSTEFIGATISENLHSLQSALNCAVITADTSLAFVNYCQQYHSMVNFSLAAGGFAALAGLIHAGRVVFKDKFRI